VQLPLRPALGKCVNLHVGETREKFCVHGIWYRWSLDAYILQFFLAASVPFSSAVVSIYFSALQRRCGLVDSRLRDHKGSLNIPISHDWALVWLSMQYLSGPFRSWLDSSGPNVLVAEQDLLCRYQARSNIGQLAINPLRAHFYLIVLGWSANCL
jgi:hypothetical protein